MSAWYNEHEPFAAEWLRQLIRQNLIAPGEVDERDIQQVKAADLRGFTQCHFFAGIGVWSHALRAAGWADDSRVWTGSCPCQGFSASGKREGFSDQRHLWPAWFRLIRECAPHVIFGEQVASKDGLAWFDVVSADMEGEGYAIGVADTCAAGFGAPHIRQRLYFVADSTGVRREQRRNTASASIQGECAERSREQEESGHEGELSGRPEGLCGVGRMEDSGREPSRRSLFRSGQSLGPNDEWASDQPRRSSVDIGRMADPNGRNSRPEGLQRSGQHGQFEEDGCSGVLLANPELDERRQERQDSSRSGEGSRAEGMEQRPLHGGLVNGFWREADWIYCRDEKYRPVEAGTFPLAHGIANRVGKLRGYGNALVAPQAQGFIEAYLEIGDRP